MVNFRHNKYIYISLLVIAHIHSVEARADDAIGSSLDCTEVSVDYLDNPDLTREEKLALMDRALFESLNKFELCQSEKNKSSNSASSGGGGGGAMAGDAGGASDGAGQGSSDSSFDGESVASSGISGSETPKKPKKAEDIASALDTGTGASQDMNEQTGGANGGNLNQSGGKLPDDIPSAANDDALAAQIRYAAENETDPKKKAQLWDEYRKYKG